MSKRPYVARDTKEALVVMGGHEVAKDGGIIPRHVDLSQPSRRKATESDIRLFDRYGLEKLIKMGYWGVIDRLETSELVPAGTYESRDEK